ncbi:MAG: transglycosylase SLT domain-containing protein [Syntrophales bacterium]
MISILLFLLTVASPACASNPALSSQGLEQRVDFWKKVYVQYGAADVIIHDRIYVNLIYAVATKETQNVKITEVQNALREIQSNLKTPGNLGPTAVPIFEAIVAQGLPLSSSLIEHLFVNIHKQNGIKERFRDGVIRSGRYVERFSEIMTNHDLPSELALLPLVESSFQNAKSKAGAVGVWQFTSGTGKLYMKINSKVDERLDTVRSCEAAAHFLRDNYRVLGTWPLAITAYNHGRGGMLQAQKNHGSNLTTIIGGYRGPVFGYASMNYYAEFLAAVEVYKNYPQYLGELTLDRPDSPPYKGPAMRTSKLPTKIASTPAKGAASVVIAKYKVQNGDTLSEIAQRFGMPIRNLMSKNKLNKPVIYAGQILLVRQSARHHHRRSGHNAI